MGYEMHPVPTKSFRYDHLAEPTHSNPYPHDITPWQREQNPCIGGVGTSTGMTGALHWRNTAPPPPASADTADPRQPRPSSSSAAPGMAPSPAWGKGNGVSAPDCSSPISMERQQSGSGRRSGSAGRARFVPAGGASGLGRPAWSSGRRGSEGAVYSMAGGGVSRAICWEAETESGAQQGEGCGRLEGLGAEGAYFCRVYLKWEQEMGFAKILT